MDWRAPIVLAASFLALLAHDRPAHGATRGDTDTAPPFSQLEERGAIAGRVVGPGDAGVPDVTVTVSGPPLVLSRSMTTTNRGTFRFDDLPRGAYTLRFAIAALEFDERRDVVVTAGICTRIGASLAGEPARDRAPEAARSAFNRFSGIGHLRYLDQKLQWDNLSRELKAEGSGLGSPVHRMTDAELESGGPLRRDQVWFRASVSRAAEDVGLVGFYVPACLGPDGSPITGAADRADCLQPDVTTTTAVGVELQVRWAPAHRTTIAWSASDRRKPNRGASAYTRPEATTRQSSLSWAQPLRVQHQWVVSGRAVVDAVFTYRDTRFVLGFENPGLADAQGAYDRYTLVTSRSTTESEYRRPAWNVVITGSTRREGFFGGGHDIEAGVEAGGATEHRVERTGGGSVAVFDSRRGAADPYQARIVRDGVTALGQRRVSAFLKETYERGRLTIDAGVRLDWQDDDARETAIPASPILPDLLPAVHFAGADSGVVYNDLSPRLGVGWDVGGDGRTVIGAAFARHVGQGNHSSARLQPTGQTRLVYWWNDADGDRLIDRSELDLARGLAATSSSNYDAANPAAVRTPATVDPGLKNTVVDEWSVRVERQIARRLTLRVGYVGRNTHRVQRAFPVEADGSLVSSDTFLPVVWTPTGCATGAECPPVTYFERNQALPAGTVLRNDGEYGWRHAVDVVLHKRMARGWMLDVSARWETSVWHFPTPTFDYTDPTNIGVTNSAEDPALGSRWVVEVAGTARLPWGVVASGLATARDGSPYERGVTTPNRGSLGSTVADLKTFGSERYPAAKRVDVRLERRTTAGRMEIVPAVEVFNLLNANTVLARDRVQNAPSANHVTRILSPRAVRLGLDIAW
jgi:hypothetical protein